jgi:SnoaL-like polyketide cyclase
MPLCTRSTTVTSRPCVSPSGMRPGSPGPGATGGQMIHAMSDDELVDPDAVIRTPLPIGATGADALKQVWAMLREVYPDLHLRVEDLIAEDDKVVGRTTVTATHQGEFMGVAATGKPVTYNEIFIFRCAAGPSG